jgi:ubiquinone biosynthesis protein Coq4
MENTKQINAAYRVERPIHEKLILWWLGIIAPIVFYFGSKEKAWEITTADLLKLPGGTLGNELGKFYRKENLEPIPRAELHDVFHVLFNYSTSLKGEAALQFLLWGNGKTSIASIGTVLGAGVIFPRQWNYFQQAYDKGKRCADISTMDFKSLLTEDLQKLRSDINYQ